MLYFGGIVIVIKCNFVMEKALKVIDMAKQFHGMLTKSINHIQVTD